ncbi:MAG TPA: alpha/beta fold hydrolase [Thermoanaerobaculia bacterium]|nr:alpha/beta fold hydrolase [Thermoanaerobaculia bacterium]
MTTIVLLPGMDGTGELFRAFLACAPATLQPLVVPLPHAGSYEELLARIGLPDDEELVLLGESFSGPLALRLAEREGGRVSAVILCNSFVRAPYPGVLRWLPWPLAFLWKPHAAFIRWLFLGRDAPDAAVKEVQRAIARTPRRVLAARVRAILTLDAVPVPVPVLYLRGTEDRLIHEVPPGVTVREIRGPHLLLQTAPGEAWRAIEDFLVSGR